MSGCCSMTQRLDTSAAGRMWSRTCRRPACSPLSYSMSASLSRKKGTNPLLCCTRPSQVSQQECWTAAGRRPESRDDNAIDAARISADGQQFISNCGTQEHGHQSIEVMRRCRGGRCQMHCRAFLCGLLDRNAPSSQPARAVGSHRMSGQSTPEFWTRVLHPGFMCPHICHSVGHVPSSSFLRVGILAAPSLQLTARECEYYVFVKLQSSMSLARACMQA